MDRNCSHRILADGADVRDDHDADDKSSAQHVKPRQLRPQFLKRRRYEQQRKIAVHDGGNGAEQFQRWLHDLACAARRVFAQVDGNPTAHGHGHGKRNARGHKGAGDQRQDAVMRFWKERRPLSVGEKVP